MSSSSGSTAEIAFVLAGGGSLGAVEVGMLLALAEYGIAPEVIVGTSVGAINAAWIAGRPGLDGVHELAAIWRSVRRKDVFPINLWVAWNGAMGRRDYMVPPSRLRRLLAENLNYGLVEDANVPVRMIATDITTGLEVVLERGPVIDAVAASAAIPGVFPPVRIDDIDLIDGGVADNTPISYALSAGARTIYVLPTGYACSLTRAPRGALAIAIHAITFLVHQRLRGEVERYQESVDLRVVPPLCPLDISPVDFSHSAELIDRAHQSTREWLDTRTGSEDGVEAMTLNDSRLN